MFPTVGNTMMDRYITGQMGEEVRLSKENQRLTKSATEWEAEWNRVGAADKSEELELENLGLTEWNHVDVELDLLLIADEPNILSQKCLEKSVAYAAKRRLAMESLPALPKTDNARYQKIMELQAQSQRMVNYPTKYVLSAKEKNDEKSETINGSSFAVSVSLMASGFVESGVTPTASSGTSDLYAPTALSPYSSASKTSNISKTLSALNSQSASNSSSDMPPNQRSSWLLGFDLWFYGEKKYEFQDSLV